MNRPLRGPFIVVVPSGYGHYVYDCSRKEADDILTNRPDAQVLVLIPTESYEESTQVVKRRIR